MFSSVRLVQEVSRSAPSSSSSSSSSSTTTSSSSSSSSSPAHATVPDSSNNNNSNNNSSSSPEVVLSVDTNTPSATDESPSHDRSSLRQDHQHQQQPSPSSPFWPPHSVQPMPFSFNNYTPATPSLPLWISSYSYNKPARGIRSLFLGMTQSSSPQAAIAGAPAGGTAAMSTPRTHTRRNSRHVRRSSRQIYATKQPGGGGRRGSRTWSMAAGGLKTDAKDKSKSQKLLCLWPLPVITRYTILISLIVSSLNFFNLLNVTCSSPSFVIYRLEILNMLLSTFLFDWSLQGILLFSWNILVLGLFEGSLTHMLGGTRRFMRVLFGIVLGVFAVRQALGYVFSKSTGWAVPMLFFSNSMHECNQGIAPFLFALLVIQSLSIDDKYIMIYGTADDLDQKVTVRKVTLQLFMCLVNYTTKNILWWSLTGLLTGFIVAQVTYTCLVTRNARQQQRDLWDTMNNSSINNSSGKDVIEEYQRSSKSTTPLWRLLWSALKKGTAVVMITLPVLFIFNSYYHSRGSLVDPATLNQLTNDRYMFTFVVMTAPRRGDPPLLSRTLSSYLANWPVDPEPNSLYSRIQIMVYTHFSNHSQFDVAREKFSNDLKGQRYLKWVREEGDQMNQRLHVSKALQLAADSFQSTYISLVEDDFPVCGSDAWRNIENVIYEANEHAPDHCGVFVATGGSGLFLKPHVARLVSDLLVQYKETPPDIVIQRCLRGELPECSQCKQALVTSKTLLMHHIGFNTSTSEDRVYTKDQFQCGWRHPFNGDPGVITL
ncbi:hypothetical protein BDB00DRAFT_786835 [Zychaea mexicana]|uniref:uncharacterized protein n=1 Tax=Zychaea mexicana TaxID=64656 RepID=UPI0022FE2A3B|nr:uncharacterized protein BDB00DRAFT_786835 [Zychaea mexicana]KAI9494993.1 hypothetical protein BDB00DRAFT_786835 [Zychaea mexicana]